MNALFFCEPSYAMAMSTYPENSVERSGEQHRVVLESEQSAQQALLATAVDPELLTQAAEKGAVWVKRRKPNGQLAKLVRLKELATVLPFESEVFANINTDVLKQTVNNPTLLQLHKNYSFWYKPRGVLSQGSKWGDHTAMPTLVRHQHGAPTYLVHRLDQQAQGVMVLAHTRPAVQALTALFAKQQVIKRYRVTVSGLWSHAVPFRCEAPLDEQQALTVVESFDVTDDQSQSHLSVTLHTGRKHQIRRHLAAQGHPVVGDFRYGDPGTHQPLELAATDLGFTCPFANKPVHCTVPTELLDQG